MMENAAASKASPYAIEIDGCTFCYKGLPVHRFVTFR